MNRQQRLAANAARMRESRANESEIERAERLLRNRNRERTRRRRNSQVEAENNRRSHRPTETHDFTRQQLEYILHDSSVDELTEYFKSIDSDVAKACLMFYLNSGYAQFDQYKEFDGTLKGQNIDSNHICNLIRNETLTEEELHTLIKNFYNKHSLTDTTLYACGLCGVREMSVPDRIEYLLMDLNSIDKVHYTQEKMEELEALIEDGIIEIPISATETREVQSQCVRSYYKSRFHLARYYHVHPELVEIDFDERTESTRVCPSCQNQLKNNKVPILSIANGVDFGNFKRILGLTEPNLHEQMILSQMRLFQAIVKITPNTVQRNFTRHNIKGNAIMFLHDAPKVAHEAFNERMFDNILQLYFLDGNDKIDQLQRAIHKTNNIFANSYVVKQWLLLLQKVNPWFENYTSDIIDDTITATEDAVERAQENIKIINDESSIRHEESLGSDVAAIQQEDTTNEQNDSNYENELNGSFSLPLRFSYVLPTANSIFNNPNIQQQVILERIGEIFEKENKDMVKENEFRHEDEQISLDANSMNSDFDVTDENSNYETHRNENESTNAIDDDDDLREENDFQAQTNNNLNSNPNDPIIYKSRRTNDAINEFQSSNYLLGACFPNVFLLGIGYKKSVGYLNARERNHLLKQFTLIPCRNRRLLGYLQDAKKRHAVITGVSAQVKGNEKAIKEMQQMLEKGENELLFQKAIKDPNGNDAKKIMKKVLPLINISGRNVPYGSVENSICLSRILEMTRRYGPAFSFLTISLDDINNPRGIRMAYNTIDNKTFPACFHEPSIHGSDGREFMQKLREASEVKSSGIINLPDNISSEHLRCNLAKLAMSNPVAYVQESKSMMNDILSCLLCLQPEDFYSAMDCKSSRKTKYFKVRGKGIFGHIMAYIGMVEDHQKGTLHYHLLLYGSISPYALQRFSSLSDVCASISSSLNKMFRAKLPVHKQVRHLIPKVIRDMKEIKIMSNELNQLIPPPLLERDNPILSLTNNDGYTIFETIWEKTNNQAGVQTYHQHYLTCRKGLNGHIGCRLCKPSGECTGTHPVLLDPIITLHQDQSNKRNENKYDFDVINPYPTKENIQYNAINPSITETKEIIVWEMDRPVPLLSDNEYQTIEELEDHYNNSPLLVCDYIIHQLREWLENDDAYPMNSPFWNWIEAAEYPIIYSFYTTIIERLQKSNGYVVDHNPILLYCTGSHHNASLLGSSEQSNAAMFYVSPYMVKGKMELAVCLAIMEKTRQDIKKFPSIAEDYQTHPMRRQVQHFLTRCLNKMNSLIELSDYQVAADLLNLPCQITSDIFGHTSPYAYIAYKEHIQSKKNAEIIENQYYSMYNDYIDRMEQEEDNGSNACDFIVESNYEDDENDVPEQIRNNQFISQQANHILQEATLPNSEFSAFQSTDSSIDIRHLSYSDEVNDTVLENQGNNIYDFEIENTENIPIITPESTQQFSQNLQNCLRNLGAVAFYTIEDENEVGKKIKQVVPYSAHFAHRGKQLKNLSHSEYDSLIIIKKRAKITQNTRSKQFLFDDSYILHTQYAQFLRAKQRTLIFNGKAPSLPGPKPTDSEAALSKWEERANKFAEYYLIAFRPEPECYCLKQTNNYKYDWDALQNWINECQESTYMLDKLRLAAFHTRVHSLKSNFKTKVIINKYRGRKRDLWDNEQHEHFNQEDRLQRKAIQHDRGLIDELLFQQDHATLKDFETKHIHDQIKDDDSQSLFFDKCNNSFHVTSNNDQTTMTNNAEIHSSIEQQQLKGLVKMIYDKNELEVPEIEESLFSEINFEENNRFIHSLNERQQEIYNVYKSYFINPEKPEERPPPLVLLTGSAGSGKSYVIECLTRLAKETNQHIIKTAYNNLNALDIDGDTLTSLAALKSHHHDKCDDLTPTQATTIMKIFNFADAKLIIIDEISNVAPYVLSRLDFVCKQTTGIYDKMFGGIPILMVGDLHQKPPVYGKPLADALMKLKVYIYDVEKSLSRVNSQKTEQEITNDLVMEAEAYFSNLEKRNTISNKKPRNLLRNPSYFDNCQHGPKKPQRIGAEIFEQAKWLELTQQQRSINDTDHTSFVHSMYNGERISMEAISGYKQISQDDFDSPQSPWLDAPIIVATNREKITLNFKRAIHYAKMKNTVVIRWQTSTTQWEQKPSENDDDIAEVMEDPAFYELFVPGAYGYCNDNISKSKGIVNGTKIQYVSLTLEEEEEQIFQLQLKTANAGSVITLTKRPISINVRLVKEATNNKEKWSKITLIPNDVVIPIIAKRINSSNASKRIPIRGINGRVKPSRIVIRNEFPLELSFAMTVEKSQGQTMENAILALSCRNAHSCNMDYASIYVAFSRVRKKNNIRLLLSGSCNTHAWDSIQYISSLKVPKYLHAYFKGFDSDDQTWTTRSWDKKKALEYYNQDNTSRSLSD